MTFSNIPPLAPVLALLIVVGYVVVLWRLLRGESRLTLLLLGLVCAVSVALRLFYTTHYPHGLNEDEPNLLQSAMILLRGGKIFGESSVCIPVLLATLFEAQLVPILGPTRWAIRTYSLVTSVLSSAAIFGVARSWRVRLAPSLAAAALVAVLPWALLYGRTHLGGELVFHELLLLAALVRIIWADGGWAEVATGGFAQCLLLYDYWAGRAMVGMCLVAAVLARGRQRLLCLLIIVVALIGYMPYLQQRPTYMIRGLTDELRPEVVAHPIEDISHRTIQTLRTFVFPEANNGFATIQSGAMHPLLILAVAGLGVLLNPGRRALFLLAGFLGGIAPAVLSVNAPSTHRMLMAYVFIPLAVALALDRLRWRTVRVAATGVLVAVVAAQSLALYFSPGFWSKETGWVFDWETTELVEALPPAPHPRFVLMRSVGYYFDPRALVDPNYEFLTADNWYPANGQPLLYGFEHHAGPLKSFYEELLGYERVESFGRAFLVKFGAGDWSWLRQHGWTYEAQCGDTRRTGQVPVLYQLFMTFKDLHCADAVTHTWRGRWTGPASTLRLIWNGAARVTVDDAVAVDKSGYEQTAEFHVDPGAAVSVSINSGPPAVVQLFELTPAGERLPPWERVEPMPAVNVAEAVPASR